MQPLSGSLIKTGISNQGSLLLLALALPQVIFLQFSHQCIHSKVMTALTPDLWSRLPQESGLVKWRSSSEDTFKSHPSDILHLLPIPRERSLTHAPIDFPELLCPVFTLA